MWKTIEERRAYFREASRRWNARNPGKNSEKFRKYSKKFPEKIKAYRRKAFHKKYATPRGKIEKILGTSVSQFIRDTKPKKRRTSSLSARVLGASWEEVRRHIESKFKDGMTWENWSRFGWHLDHIIPRSKFDLTISEQQFACFHYTNLQPLWWYENIKKSSSEESSLQTP